MTKSEWFFSLDRLWRYCAIVIFSDFPKAWIFGNVIFLWIDKKSPAAMSDKTWVYTYTLILVVFLSLWFVSMTEWRPWLGIFKHFKKHNQVSVYINDWHSGAFLFDRASKKLCLIATRLIEGNSAQFSHKIAFLVSHSSHVNQAKIQEIKSSSF